MAKKLNQIILVLDFGGQYKELIARSVRAHRVYSVIRSGTMGANKIKELNPIGIILTGGPESVYEGSLKPWDPDIFNLGIPILGICYGMQLMCHTLGGKVEKGKTGEYGTTMVHPVNGKAPFLALMSHRDSVSQVPEGFSISSRTEHYIASIECPEKKLYAVQYHPESSHTEDRGETFRHFLFDICGAMGDYDLQDFIENKIMEIRQEIQHEKVLLAVSGGVDSTVCAGLLSRALGKQLYCVFVDHGFMRQNEADEINDLFSRLDLTFISIKAQDRFFKALEGITNPEEKRKIIGKEFIRVFEESAAQLGNIPYLAQGTIYPDIVESGGLLGDTIKSHHNVGGIPYNIAFRSIIEPLSSLFKDEVRIIGQSLDIPKQYIERQPFPGPGLAIRIIGDITQDKLNKIRHSDSIVREELDKIPNPPDQYFAVLLNTPSVGVKGDARTYDPVVAIRAVETTDFMTCNYTPLPHDVLLRMSRRICGEVEGISRVVYDITSKPPSTIEWE
ncbi:MAG: glutamine-hydrolyzing GMP synthase [Treponema sp.]|nr:glutamine-hydrolyzing GMP synthase [Treponema sp.]